MSEVMTPELASLMDLAEVVSVVESLKRRVLGLQQVITDEQRRRRDLMARLAVERQDLLARLAVEQVEHAQLAARVAMLETSMTPPWADAADVPVTNQTCPECEVWCVADQAPWPVP